MNYVNMCQPPDQQINLFTTCSHPYNMKHSQPCSQGFLYCNKLEIENVFAVFNKAVSLCDTEEAGGKPARNGSL